MSFNERSWTIGFSDKVRDCPVVTGMSQPMLVDFDGNNDRLLVFGLDQDREDQAGTLFVYDPYDFAESRGSVQPLYRTRICNTPPSAFGEAASPCSAVPIIAKDMDATRGDELIVAWNQLDGPTEFVAFTRGAVRGELTELGHYWHFGWPCLVYNDDRATDTNHHVFDDGHKRLALLVRANAAEPGRHENLPKEPTYSAILVLDCEELLQPGFGAGGSAFWGVNDRMRSTNHPPARYGHVLKAFANDDQEEHSWSPSCMGIRDRIELQLKNTGALILGFDLIPLTEGFHYHVPQWSDDGREPPVGEVWVRDWPPQPASGESPKSVKDLAPHGE